MSEYEQDAEGASSDPLAPYEAILQPLRDKHGEIAVYPIPKVLDLGDILVVAAPVNAQAYGVYTNNMHNERADKFTESRKFALACIVYPDFEKAKQLLTLRPGYVTTVSNRGAALAGAGTEELGKG